MSGWNPHSCHPNATPFNYPGYNSPQPIVAEYSGSNPWEYFHYLESVGQLDEYWVQWASEQGYYSGGGRIPPGQHQYQQKYLPPPSIGRGPRPIIPSGGSSQAMSGHHHQQGGGRKPNPNTVPLRQTPPPSPFTSITTSSSSPFTTPSQRPPGMRDSTTTTTTTTSSSSTSSHLPPTQPPPETYINLSQIKQTKLLEHTAALTKGRPLDMRKVIPSKVIVSSPNVAGLKDNGLRGVHDPPETTMTMMTMMTSRNNSSLVHDPSEPSLTTGTTATMTTTRPLSETTTALATATASAPGSGSASTSIPTSMHLSPEEAPIYRIGQRGLSNEYLKTILPPEPDLPPHPHHPPSTEETWDTSLGRIKMFQLADMVFQFKVGREQALGMSGRGKGKGKGKGKEVGGGGGGGGGDGQEQIRLRGWREDDNEEEDEGGFQAGVDENADDDDETKLALDEDELWPVLLEKDIKDL